MSAIAAEFFTTNRIVGVVLREARDDALLTQGEVARELHVSQSAMASWENGARTVTVERLLDLARLYAIPADVLMSVIERRCQR